MSDEDDDQAIAKLWRGVAGETPGPLLDARIIAAARAQQRLRRLAPFAAAMAACLVLAVFMMQQPVPVPAPEAVALDTSTFGLDIGRGVQSAPDFDAVQQMRIRQQPGGSIISKTVTP